MWKMISTKIQPNYKHLRIYNDEKPFECEVYKKSL